MKEEDIKELMIGDDRARKEGIREEGPRKDGLIEESMRKEERNLFVCERLKSLTRGGL